MTKDEEIALLKAENAALVQEVQSFKDKVAQLLRIIEKLGIKKAAVAMSSESRFVRL